MQKIFSFFKKKKVIAGIAILALILFFVFKGKGSNIADIQSESVKKQDIKQTVLATGQVTSQTDLALAFKTSGIISRVNAQVGDKVKAGAVLAFLDQKDQVARLTQAKGALKQAEANYQKVLDGSSNEEVAVARVTLENAQKTLEDVRRQQQVLVDNAYKALLNSSLEAIPNSSNLNNITLTISGTYTGTEQGTYTIMQEGLSFYVLGLENRGNQTINTSVSVPLPLGTRGLYVQFPSTITASNDSWTVKIPNTKASGYVTNLNAYESALQTQKAQITSAENNVLSAQANLELKLAKARPAELESAKAQILTAEGQVLAASADLENTIMRAPAEGTITKVDAKPGQLATALAALVVLQDIGNLHVEANISEANIAYIKPDQEVELTFDALGVDRKFVGKVQAVDPASTLVSGVVNYKVTISLDKLSEIKPGMTANISILTGSKQAVLTVPLRAVIVKGNAKYLRIIKDSKKKTYDEILVTTGMEADGGLVEVLEGVNEGQEIVTYIKQ